LRLGRTDAPNTALAHYASGNCDQPNSTKHPVAARLAGKAALFTGTGSGIGAACGRRFAGALDRQLGKSSLAADRTRIGA